MQQMDKILADGGVMQEGGTVDPVSGNKVPPGAMQEEVRDDIDAKLSEGEFVFPADVVRYFGLQKLMAMRDEAKQGLAKMEEIGQMGNAQEVENPEALHSTGAPAGEDMSSFESEVDAALAGAQGEESEQAFAIGGTPAPKKTETYVNDAGQEIYIPVVQGASLVDIPMGFVKKETMAPAVQTPEPMQQQPVQQMAKGGLAKRKKK
jgi:Arc/MetJ-type ribon-helix-helix transcriptional regulator